MSREQEDAALRIERADELRGLESIQAGHDEVGEQNIGAPAGGEADSSLTVGGGAGDKPVLIQDESEGISDGGLIVGNQDFGLATGPGFRKRDAQR